MIFRVFQPGFGTHLTFFFWLHNTSRVAVPLPENPDYNKLSAGVLLKENNGAFQAFTEVGACQLFRKHLTSNVK